MIQVNENAPHKTVIFIRYITYELLSTGECGKPIEKTEEQYQIDGDDKCICIEKTKVIMEDIKKCCAMK